MAAEGLEKFTEGPVEFFNDGAAFVKKCTKPDQKGMYLCISLFGHQSTNSSPMSHRIP